MKCEILVSTTDQNSKNDIIKRLGITKWQKCLVINQITNNARKPKDEPNGNHRFITYSEKGLSRSRNHAIEHAKGDICIISDDDMEFTRDYEEVIKEAYEKHQEADIITFGYKNANSPDKKYMKEGQVGYLRSMKISSAQITFRKKAIEETGIRFDEEFGAGAAEHDWGEENIFLFDCLRAGLRIYHVPSVVRTVYDFGSTWNRENTVDHFKQQGAVYYRMSKKIWIILCLQFAIRKRYIFKKELSPLSVFKAMIVGARNYKRSIK